MSNNTVKPSINLTPNTSVGLSHVSVNANDHGGSFSTGAKLTHNINKNFSVHTGATVTRNQSFHGYGGHTAPGAFAGFSWRF